LSFDAKASVDIIIVRMSANVFFMCNWKFKVLITGVFGFYVSFVLS
jgi:hypothetical protein